MVRVFFCKQTSLPSTINIYYSHSGNILKINKLRCDKRITRTERKQAATLYNIYYVSSSTNIHITLYHFYRAMLRRARLCHSMPYVRPSVRNVHTVITQLEYFEIISRLISLRIMLGLTQTRAIWTSSGATGTSQN